MYIHNLPDWPALEKLFNENGYHIEVDLSNNVMIEKPKHSDNWIDYDQLPKHLQKAMDKFAENNNLND